MGYIVEQLHCPLSESDLPRLVVISKLPESWRRLWTCREGLGHNAQVWLAQFEASKVVPIVGSSIEVNTLKGGEAVQRFLTKRVGQMAGTWPQMPDWFYGPTSGVGTNTKRPLIRLLPRQWFESVSAASRDTGHPRNQLRRWCELGHKWQWA